jgi:peptidyl-prolyl cis-trans isomerase C
MREPFRRVVREPLVHFIGIGALIWAVASLATTGPDRYVLEVTAVEQQRLAERYQQQFGNPPTQQQRKALIDRYVREEIFVRESRALGLDQGDEIIRRRLIQKYEFLQTDLATARVPDESTLEAWFERSAAHYRLPERVGLSHIYFSVDGQGERIAKERAIQALNELSPKELLHGHEPGDAFPGPLDIRSLEPDEARKLFGDSALSRQIFHLPERRWFGPFRSGYGWHLVYITDSVPSELPAFAQVRGQVLADYQEAERRGANERAYETLRAQYRIRVSGDSP